ncbi:MAG: hypothetical protein AAF483_04990 [Planctomycetota bacterium]
MPQDRSGGAGTRANPFWSETFFCDENDFIHKIRTESWSENEGWKTEYPPELERPVFPEGQHSVTSTKIANFSEFEQETATDTINSREFNIAEELGVVETTITEAALAWVNADRDWFYTTLERGYHRLEQTWDTTIARANYVPQQRVWTLPAMKSGDSVLVNVLDLSYLPGEMDYDSLEQTNSESVSVTGGGAVFVDISWSDSFTFISNCEWWYDFNDAVVPANSYSSSGSHAHLDIPSHVDNNSFSWPHAWLTGRGGNGGPGNGGGGW